MQGQQPTRDGIGCTRTWSSKGRKRAALCTPPRKAARSSRGPATRARCSTRWPTVHTRRLWAVAAIPAPCRITGCSSCNVGFPRRAMRVHAPHQEQPRWSWRGAMRRPCTREFFLSNEARDARTRQARGARARGGARALAAARRTHSEYALCSARFHRLEHTPMPRAHSAYAMRHPLRSLPATRTCLRVRR